MNNKVIFLAALLLQLSLSCIPQPLPLPTRPPPLPPPPPPPPCRCGVPQVNRNRIVGGQAAEKNEYPWLVVLVNRWSGRPFPFCGGTLLSSKTVLTAAHCQEKLYHHTRVHIGEHDVKESDGEQIRRVSRFISHPEYFKNWKTGIPYYDFAIIILDNHVTFSHAVMPACLPTPGRDYDSVVATVAGWGRFGSGLSQPDVPYEVDVDTINNTACITSSKYISDYITGNMICAKRTGKDSCQDDSGGPLVTKDPTSFSVIGVVSWGFGCAEEEHPGVYARVTSQLGWIQSMVEGNTCPM